MNSGTNMMLHAMHVVEINQVVVHCSSALEWLNPPELSLNIRDRTDNSQRVSIIEDIPCKGLFTQNAPWSGAHTRSVNVFVVFNDFDYNDMQIAASERSRWSSRTRTDLGDQQDGLWPFLATRHAVCQIKFLSRQTFLRLCPRFC